MSSTTNSGSVMRMGMLSCANPSRAACTRPARESTSVPWNPSG